MYIWLQATRVATICTYDEGLLGDAGFERQGLTKLRLRSDRLQESTFDHRVLRRGVTCGMFEGVRVLTLPLREVPGVAYLFARQAIGLMAEVGVHVEFVHLSVVEELAEGRIGQALLALPRRAAVTHEGRAGRQEPEDVDRIVVLASEFVPGSLRDLFPLVVLGHTRRRVIRVATRDVTHSHLLLEEQEDVLALRGDLLTALMNGVVANVFAIATHVDGGIVVFGTLAPSLRCP